MAPAPAPTYITTTVRAPAPGPGEAPPPNTGANVSLQLSGISAQQFAQKEQEYNHLIAQVGYLHHQTCSSATSAAFLHWYCLRLWDKISLLFM